MNLVPERMQWCLKQVIEALAVFSLVVFGVMYASMVGIPKFTVYWGAESPRECIYVLDWETGKLSDCPEDLETLGWYDTGWADPEIADFFGR